MQNGKISSFQFLVLVIFFTVGTSILLIPAILTSQVKQDAWIAAIVGLLIGLLFIWLFTFIASWFPKLTYIQINEKIFGKIFGKMISIICNISGYNLYNSLNILLWNFLNYADVS